MKLKEKLIDVSLDRLTILGDLYSKKQKEIPSKLRAFLQYDPDVRMISQNSGLTKFQIFNKAFFEIASPILQRKTLRLEFNPNSLTDNEKKVLQLKLLPFFKNIHLTRVDVAIDFEEDLSNYHFSTKRTTKTTKYFGLLEKLETIYFGGNSAERKIRIYDKKTEQKEKLDYEVPFEHFWRVEFELTREYANDFLKLPFYDNLTITQSVYPEEWNWQEKAVIFALQNGVISKKEISKNVRPKYVKLINELQEVQETNVLGEIIEQNKVKLKSQLEEFTNYVYQKAYDDHSIYH